MPSSADLQQQLADKPVVHDYLNPREGQRLPGPGNVEYENYQARMNPVRDTLNADPAMKEQLALADKWAKDKFREQNAPARIKQLGKETGGAFGGQPGAVEVEAGDWAGGMGGEANRGRVADEMGVSPADIDWYQRNNPDGGKFISQQGVHDNINAGKAQLERAIREQEEKDAIIAQRQPPTIPTPGNPHGKVNPAYPGDRPLPPLNPGSGPRRDDSDEAKEAARQAYATPPPELSSEYANEQFGGPPGMTDKNQYRSYPKGYGTQGPETLGGKLSGHARMGEQANMANAATQSLANPSNTQDMVRAGQESMSGLGDAFRPSGGNVTIAEPAGTAGELIGGSSVPTKPSRANGWEEEEEEEEEDYIMDPRLRKKVDMAMAM
jgi:hypothetical protein